MCLRHLFQSQFAQIQYCNMSIYLKALVYLPKSGRDSDVLGMFSDSVSMKTEKESRMEMPSEIFSPWSGGDKNVTRVRDDSMAQGRIKFIV